MNRSVTDSGMPRNQGNEKTAIFALTRKGAELAARISARIPGSSCFCNYRYALPAMTAFRKISEVFPSAWRECDSIICIMGCGIAVRMVAPLLEDKFADPAVVVVDQDGRFAVSLVSGHIGGANDLARKAASITGGQAVITTASDLQDKPAVDIAAKRAGLRIENRRMLGRIEAAILDEEPLWIFDPDGFLLKHLPADHGLRVIGAGVDFEVLRQGLGVWISETLPPRGVECLKLRPVTLVIGIGCNRGTESDEIVAFVGKKLEEYGFAPLSIRNFASLDIKSDERGLLDAAKAFGRPIHFCAREEIEGIAVPNPSETVARHVGAKSVCEASALWSAGTRQLLVPKQKAGNCTLAVARVGSP
jgi:cobalt-precorrin 5A hydrolase